MAPMLVDPGITIAKFREELRLWKENSGHLRRGCLLLSEDEVIPAVELAFLAKIAISVGNGFLPVMVCTVRLTYENYDLWPPSLTFIDPFTRTPTAPHVQAFLPTPEGPRNVLIHGHPDTKRPFLCFPGIREYHSHPQHSGDDWMIHRVSREGSITIIEERIWRTMVRNVMGLSVSLQGLPTFPLQAQVGIQVAQGDIDNISIALGSGTRPAER